MAACIVAAVVNDGTAMLLGAAIGSDAKTGFGSPTVVVVSVPDNVAMAGTDGMFGIMLVTDDVAAKRERLLSVLARLLSTSSSSNFLRLIERVELRRFCTIVDAAAVFITAGVVGVVCVDEAGMPRSTSEVTLSDNEVFVESMASAKCYAPPIIRYK